MDKFTRENCRKISARIQEALEAVGEELGVTIETGNGRFAADRFNLKLEIHLGEGVDTGKRDWERTCIYFGLKPEDFGRSFRHAGTTFTVCGIKPKSKKYPILARNANGTTYKFPVEVLRNGL